jgi:uncharacterized coiled-coil protein SlyX
MTLSEAEQRIAELEDALSLRGRMIQAKDKRIAELEADYKAVNGEDYVDPVILRQRIAELEQDNSVLEKTNIELNDRIAQLEAEHEHSD